MPCVKNFHHPTAYTYTFSSSKIGSYKWTRISISVLASLYIFKQRRPGFFSSVSLSISLAALLFVVTFAFQPAPRSYSVQASESYSFRTCVQPWNWTTKLRNREVRGDYIHVNALMANATFPWYVLSTTLQSIFISLTLS